MVSAERNPAKWEISQINAAISSRRHGNPTVRIKGKKSGEYASENILEHEREEVLYLIDGKSEIRRSFFVIILPYIPKVLISLKSQKSR